jgi:hypothetical protein
VPTPFLASLPLDGLEPSIVWSHLPAEARALAARSLYTGERGDSTTRRLADAAIARTIRFREVAVRKLPLDRRVDYLARAVHPDDSLGSALLLALHMEHRRPMLAAFLDALEIPHENGAIADASQLAPQSPDRLAAAAERLFGEFPADNVEVYLASLLAMDPETWGALATVLARLGGGTAAA